MLDWDSGFICLVLKASKDENCTTQSLSEQLVSLLYCPHGENIFPYVQCEPLLFYVRSVLPLTIYHQWCITTVVNCILVITSYLPDKSLCKLLLASL